MDWSEQLTRRRPVMVLWDLLGRRWTMRIIWELRAGAQNFRELQARCDDVSPTVLNARLKSLRAAQIVELTDSGYRLTRLGRDLIKAYGPLGRWAERWAAQLRSPW